jgi:hypothetical protein
MYCVSCASGRIQFIITMFPVLDYSMQRRSSRRAWQPLGEWQHFSFLQLPQSWYENIAGHESWYVLASLVSRAKDQYFHDGTFLNDSLFIFTTATWVGNFDGSCVMSYEDLLVIHYTLTHSIFNLETITIICLYTVMSSFILRQLSRVAIQLVLPSLFVCYAIWLRWVHGILKKPY